MLLPIIVSSEIKILVIGIYPIQKANNAKISVLESMQTNKKWICIANLWYNKIWLVCVYAGCSDVKINAKNIYREKNENELLPKASEKNVWIIL